VDTFITALNDKELEYEVLKLAPVTLEEAANHAMRFDALAKSLDTRVPAAQGRAGGQGQGRQRNVYAVADDKPETRSNVDLLQRIWHKWRNSLSGLLVVARARRVLLLSLTLNGIRVWSKWVCDD